MVLAPTEPEHCHYSDAFDEHGWEFIVTYSAGGLIVSQRMHVCKHHINAAVLAHPRKRDDDQARQYGGVTHAIVTPRQTWVEEEDEDDD